MPGPKLNELGRVRGDFGWVRSVERHGHRLFFDPLREMLDRLEARRSFVAGYLASGGDAVFTVQAYGRENIGDILSAESVMRVAKLWISLTFEVVPDWPLKAAH